MTAQPVPATDLPERVDSDRRWHTLLSVALASLGFFLPFSSAGVAITLGGLLVLALMRLRVVRASAPWREPAIAAGLALFAYIAAHTLWTSGFTWRALVAVNHYHELVLAPLLLALLQDARHRRVFIGGLIAGSVLLALGFWLALAINTGSQPTGSPPLLMTRRISAGFALATCGFLVLIRARGKLRVWPARALAAFLALTILFAIDARTGYLVLLLFASFAAWIHSPPRWRWLAALAAPLLIVTVAITSVGVRDRFKETLAGAEPGVLSSTVVRVELLRIATDIARQYGATGAGFANYAVVHEQAARARAASEPGQSANLQARWLHIGNPHNEYLMQLIGGGVASLTLFLAWLGVALRTGARAKSTAGAMLIAITLAFAVSCLFNSSLLDFTEGHLYMAVLAWLLAEIRAPREQDDTQRILVISTRQIGDVLLTTPLIHAARERWPQARIEVLGFQGTLGMLRGNPDVDELIETPERPGWSGWRALLRRIWRGYDLALVTDPGDRAHLLGWMAARSRSGIVPHGGGSNWWKKLLLDHTVVAAGDRGEVHVTTEKQSLLAPWAEAAASRVPQVTLPQGAPLPAEVQRQLLPGAIVVHAPSMWPYKQWPIAHFERLVKALLETGRQVVLTGSGSARDQECVAPLRALAEPPRLLDLSGQLDFNQLVVLFKRAALYIGPDTSVSHLAAATGVPVIAIFGPTNPLRWAPWPARAEARELFKRSMGVQQAGNVTVIQSGLLPCVPCGRAGCEDHRQSRSDCLVDITPERVLEQAVKVLASLLPPPSSPSPSGGGLGWGHAEHLQEGQAPIPTFPQRGKE